MDTMLRIIGSVHSPLTDLKDCPKNGDEGAPQAWIEVHPEYSAGLATLEIGQEITLITWLHQANRNTLTVYPRGDRTRAQRGVFNTRSPARPNPLGLHDVTILAIEKTVEGGTKLLVDPLEALNGTPLVDIKTSREQRSGSARKAVSLGAIPHYEAEQLRHSCHTAWERRLLSGFNGNVSLRYGEHCLITCTGAAKGSLQYDDIALVHIESGQTVAGGKPSSELGMHLAIYRQQPKAEAIVHTHPPCLLALGLRLPAEERLHMPVYEAELIRSRLGYAPAHAPGTEELATAVGAVAIHCEAIWMEQHGLACWGETPTKALALSEELEHLASVRLASL